MMDQMASVGVEFYPPSVLRIISQQVQQYEAKAAASSSTGAKAAPPWAVESIFRANAPLRPWGLGALLKPPSLVDFFTGRTARTPGRYRQVDPVTGDDRAGPWLRDTNERVHSSARVRLACRGLALNDQGGWTAPTLARCWRLRRTTARYPDPVPREPLWDPANHAQLAAAAAPEGRERGGGGRGPDEEERWVWEYVGPERDAPADDRQKVLVEEPLGPYERFLLSQTGGTPNVYAFAENEGVGDGMGGNGKQDSGTETDV